MEEKKFRLRLNLFDCIVVLAALAVGAFLLWRALEPEAPVEVTPQTASTGGYSVRVGGTVYLKGEGYMGSGQIVALEQEVQG